jgi:hypothetical protein
MLRLNLCVEIRQHLSNVYYHDKAFWDDVDKIEQALMLYYSKPNEIEAASIKLQKLEMDGKKLQSYYQVFCKNAAVAKIDISQPFWKQQFYRNLNNDVLPGGLRILLRAMYDDVSKTVHDLYIEADKLLRTQFGPNYSKKSSYPTNKRKPEGDAGSGSGAVKSARQKNNKKDKKNRSDKKKKRDAFHDATSCTCGRCGRNGHEEDQCNARTSASGSELPIKTTAVAKADPEHPYNLPGATYRTKAAGENNTSDEEDA